jgi:hypothetical protein
MSSLLPNFLIFGIFEIFLSPSLFYFSTKGAGHVFLYNRPPSFAAMQTSDTGFCDGTILYIGIIGKRGIY